MMIHIIQLTKNGIILSWAVEGQGGRFHVNEHNNTAIVQVKIGTVYKLYKCWDKIDSRVGVYVSNEKKENTFEVQSDTAIEFDKALNVHILKLKHWQPVYIILVPV
jgi:hypothetical protein